ncbi:MAG: DNA-binding protein [Clostridia bacterium]|nr:DNA-binding protein [Clostridia bacterium]
MFEKNLRLAYLLDFYGDVLDEHTRAVMKAYYDDDLSLAEVAEGVGISRQGVRHVIKRGEEQLIFLEERLGLAAFGDRLAKAAQRLSEIREKIASGECDPAVVSSLDEIVEAISNKG